MNQSKAAKKLFLYAHWASPTINSSKTKKYDLKLARSQRKI